MSHRVIVLCDIFKKSPLYIPKNGKFTCIMNAGSLPLLKTSIMNKPIVIKLLIILPLILFADYIIMALFGCVTCLFGLGEDFYCGPFCLAGKIILVLSLIFFGYLIYPDIRSLFKLTKDGTAKQEQEDI
jgi:hypothetical protein